MTLSRWQYCVAALFSGSCWLGKPRGIIGSCTVGHGCYYRVVLFPLFSWNGQCQYFLAVCCSLSVCQHSEKYCHGLFLCFALCLNNQHSTDWYLSSDTYLAARDYAWLMQQEATTTERDSRSILLAADRQTAADHLFLISKPFSAGLGELLLVAARQDYFNCLEMTDVILLFGC